MVAQVFADEELERLREFPEVSQDDLVRFFTLTSTDRRSSILLVGAGRATGWGCRWRCARCPGWGSSPTTCGRHRRWRWPGWPNAGPLLTRRLNTALIAGHYDDLLCLAGSLKFGHATASLLVGKLSASGRQNALAAALKEYGAWWRTIYAARYLADPVYRRKISRQLNKGESLHGGPPGYG